MSVASSKSPFLRELGALDPKNTQCTLPGTQVFWPGCPGSCVCAQGRWCIYMLGREESLLPETYLDPHIFRVSWEECARSEGQVALQ